MQRFRYEDTDGLDSLYYSNSEPVLEDDEEIIEEREVIPFVTLGMRRETIYPLVSIHNTSLSHLPGQDFIEPIKFSNLKNPSD